MSPCPDCPATAERHAELGAPVICTCGAVFAPEDFRWPDAEPAEPTAPAPRQDAALLARTLEELALARRYERERRGRAAGGPREPRSSLGALQGASSGAAADATARQVQGLARLLLAPEGRVGRRARSGFVESLLRYCDETSGGGDESVDWPRARVLELRLQALAGTAHSRVLRLLADGATPQTDWTAAARLVAYGLAPRELFEATRAKAPGTPGRPRRDRAQAPPEAALLAWGERALAAALDAWARPADLAGWELQDTLPGGYLARWIDREDRT